MANVLTLDKLVQYVEITSRKANSIKIPSSGPPTNTKSKTLKHLKPGEKSDILNYPKKLVDLFNPFVKNIKRHGIDIDQDSLNLTLYDAILSSLIANYTLYSKDDQGVFRSKLRNSLTYYTSNIDTNKYVSFAWTKKDIVSSILQYKANKIILKIIADYFNINIFILNVAENRIYIVSDINFYDIFRPSIILSYYDNVFEPVSYKNEHILMNDNELLKKLISVNRHLLLIMDLNINQNSVINCQIKFKDLTVQDYTSHVVSSEDNKKQLIDEMEKHIYKKQWNKLTPFHKIVKIKEYMNEHYKDLSMCADITEELVNYIDDGKINTKKFVVYNPNEEKILKLPCLVINSKKNSYHIKIM